MLLAFALNLDPKASDSRAMTPGTGMLGLPTASQPLVSGQKRLALEFVRRRAATLPGITYRVEFTGNLSTAPVWSTTGTESVAPIDSTWERVVVTAADSVPQKRFGRLVVTQP